jgi:adenylate kinase family enzyme
MKIFIFGAQCSGKTTVVNYLRKNSSLPLVEMDEEIMKLNHGAWPQDADYKEHVLVPKVLLAISEMPAILFFENHMNVERTKQLKQAGFSVALLEVSKAELLQRNQQRIKKQGYDDAAKWIEMQLKDIEQLKSHELIDFSIDGTQSTQLVANKILDLAS